MAKDTVAEDAKKAASAGLSLGLILANPLILVILLVFGGILFGIGYAILWAYGLVTAVLLFLGGAIFVYLIARASPNVVSAYPVILLLPLGFGAVGYAVDHLAFLSSLSLARIDSLTGDFAVDPMILSGVLLACVFLVIGVAVVTKKKKRKRKRKR